MRCCGRGEVWEVMDTRGFLFLIIPCPCLYFCVLFYKGPVGFGRDQEGREMDGIEVQEDALEYLT
jgi:hypothetical protein